MTRQRDHAWREHDTVHAALEDMRGKLETAVKALRAMLNNGPNQLIGTVPLSEVRDALRTIEGKQEEAGNA